VRAEGLWVKNHLVPQPLHQVVAWLGVDGLCALLGLRILNELAVVTVVKVGVEFADLLLAQHQFLKGGVFRGALVGEPVFVPVAAAELVGDAEDLHVLLAPVAVLVANLYFYDFGGHHEQLLVARELLVQFPHDEAGLVLDQVRFYAFALVATPLVHEAQQRGDGALHERVLSLHLGEVLVEEFEEHEEAICVDQQLAEVHELNDVVLLQVLEQEPEEVADRHRHEQAVPVLFLLELRAGFERG